jgi:phosphopantothenoylcysteine decarboxylase/phosphopantothenate--cysteine ligase
MPPGKKILLGVTGSIAAYKALELTSRLRKKGYQVTGLMTRSACQLIGPASLESLSGRPVALELFPTQKPQNIEHIELAKWADLVLVAPATANFLGKAAHGIADDLLTTVVMAAPVPVAVAPAMNVNMWNSRVVQENVKTLKSRGWRIIEPGEGLLACGDSGKGRLADLPLIEREVESILSGSNVLQDIPILITAGRTEEPLDPVRVLTNRSSGRMGYALATEAARRGASVTLITGPADIEPPLVDKLVRVKTAAEMEQAVNREINNNKALIMAAAVADYRPRKASANKIKKQPKGMSLELEPVPDILAGLARNKGPKALLIGFALESRDLLANAKRKLAEKKLDLIVANGIPALGSEQNRAVIIEAGGKPTRLKAMAKTELAGIIMDKLAARLKKGCPSHGTNVL